MKVVQIEFRCGHFGFANGYLFEDGEVVDVHCLRCQPPFYLRPFLWLLRWFKRLVT